MDNQNTPIQKLENKVMRSFVFDGLLLIALGIVILIWPNKSLNVLCDIIGAGVIAMGFIRCIICLINKYDFHKLAHLLLGIVQIVIGVMLITKSNLFIKGFSVVTGIILAYGALAMLVSAFHLRKLSGTMFFSALAFALIVLILAIVIIINPVSFAGFITRLQGISVIAEGICMMIVFRALKNCKVNNE